jgi:VanZ family protein
VPKLLFFWLALCWSGLVIFFCLVQSSAIPVVQIANLDKIVHAFFHFVFSALWFLFFEKQLKYTNLWKPLLMSFLLSFSFGIGIEIAQGLFTTSRKGDLLDILANTAGAMLAVCMIGLYKKYSSLVKR